MIAAKTYRYPGAQPFSTEQEQIFFGRDKNTQDLYRLIKQEPLLVLFAKSGLGKSSLLNAGLTPKAEREGRFLPVRIRLGAYLKDGSDTPIKTALKAFGGNTPWLDGLAPGDEKSLWYALKGHQVSRGETKQYLLIFDQFEELFTYPPKQVQAFGKDLAEALHLVIPDRFRDRLEQEPALLSEQELTALHRPLNLHVVLAIRSDRMSLLDQLKTYLPEILSTTYELPPLDNEQAENAILSPAFEPGDYASEVFDYEDEAVEFLLHYLSNRHTEPIESFQLQIICQWVEQQLVIKQGIRKVTKDHISDPASILENYYLDKIAEIEDPKQRFAAQKLIEEGLIFEEEERRLSLYEGQIRKNFGVTKELLHQLLATHLIRSEPSLRGGYTYELSHDTLVAPVLKARAHRFAKEAEKKARRNRRWFKAAFFLSVVTSVIAMVYFISTPYQQKNQTSFQFLITNADNLIRSLDYEGSLKQVKAAIKWQAEGKALEKSLLEIIYVFNETGRYSRVNGLLDTLYTQVRKSYYPYRDREPTYFAADNWHKIDSLWYDTLCRRYFPEMVPLEGGFFTMGCDSARGDRYCNEDELPPHGVELPGFQIAKTETTVWQFYIYCINEKIEILSLKPSTGYLYGDNPIVNVDWYLAARYANWLSLRKGLTVAYQFDIKGNFQNIDSIASPTFRLPTEDQWEFAARGGKRDFPTLYAGSNNLEEVGWYRDSRGTYSESQSHPVAMKKANELGLFDMSGNVWEWCENWYGESDYASFVGDIDKYPKKSERKEFRALRGGSWYESDLDCRISGRSWLTPSSKSIGFGFRLTQG